MDKFDFEKWLLQHSNYEDHEAGIIFWPKDENGGFSLADNEWYIVVDGKTLEEACNNWCSEHRKKYGYCHERFEIKEDK